LIVRVLGGPNHHRTADRQSKGLNPVAVRVRLTWRRIRTRSAGKDMLLQILSARPGGGISGIADASRGDVCDWT